MHLSDLIALALIALVLLLAFLAKRRSWNAERLPYSTQVPQTTADTLGQKESWLLRPFVLFEYPRINPQLSGLAVSPAAKRFFIARNALVACALLAILLLLVRSWSALYLATLMMAFYALSGAVVGVIYLWHDPVEEFDRWRADLQARNTTLALEQQKLRSDTAHLTTLQGILTAVTSAVARDLSPVSGRVAELRQLAQRRDQLERSAQRFEQEMARLDQEAPALEPMSPQQEALEALAQERNALEEEYRRNAAQARDAASAYATLLAQIEGDLAPCEQSVQHALASSQLSAAREAREGRYLRSIRSQEERLADASQLDALDLRLAIAREQQAVLRERERTLHERITTLAAQNEDTARDIDHRRAALDTGANDARRRERAARLLEFWLVLVATLIVAGVGVAVPLLLAARAPRFLAFPPLWIVAACLIAAYAVLQSGITFGARRSTTNFLLCTLDLTGDVRPALEAARATPEAERANDRAAITHGYQERRAQVRQSYQTRYQGWGVAWRLYDSLLGVTEEERAKSLDDDETAELAGIDKSFAEQTQALDRHVQDIDAFLQDLDHDGTEPSAHAQEHVRENPLFAKWNQKMDYMQYVLPSDFRQIPLAYLIAIAVLIQVASDLGQAVVPVILLLALFVVTLLSTGIDFIIEKPFRDKEVALLPDDINAALQQAAPGSQPLELSVPLTAIFRPAIAILAVIGFLSVAFEGVEHLLQIASALRPFVPLQLDRLFLSKDYPLGTIPVVLANRFASLHVDILPLSVTLGLLALLNEVWFMRRITPALTALADSSSSHLMSEPSPSSFEGGQTAPASTQRPAEDGERPLDKWGEALGRLRSLAEPVLLVISSLAITVTPIVGASSTTPLPASTPITVIANAPVTPLPTPVPTTPIPVVTTPISTPVSAAPTPIPTPVHQPSTPVPPPVTVAPMATPIPTPTPIPPTPTATPVPPPNVTGRWDGSMTPDSGPNFGTTIVVDKQQGSTIWGRVWSNYFPAGTSPWYFSNETVYSTRTISFTACGDPNCYNYVSFDGKVASSNTSMSGRWIDAYNNTGDWGMSFTCSCS